MVELLIEHGASLTASQNIYHYEGAWRESTLSERFDEACFFGTMRITGFTAWFRSKNGQVIRKFMYVDDVIYDEGERTGIESVVAYIDHDFDSENEKPIKHPQYCGDEDWVMQIAGDWSIDPTKLERYRQTHKALGILGYLR